MGCAALVIGIALVAFSAPLANHMQEGDERLREEQPWVESFEPQARVLASSTGRWWILRGWLLGCAAGFGLVGALLVLRAVA